MTKIVLLGEAWGETEALIRHPFVGSSGFELIRMLSDSGILTLTNEDRDNLRQRWYETDPARAAAVTAKVWYDHPEVYPTNVFNLHPERNDVDTLCTDKNGDHVGLPPIRAGKYIRREFMGEIERLRSELATHAPNVIVALGATAAWALLQTSGISRIRGAVAPSADGAYKVLPTYHPAAVLRDWSLRPITVLDLIKARRESEFPEVRRPRRKVFIPEKIDDLYWFWNEHIKNARALAPDIETRANQITCIGFATSAAVALVVPIVDDRRGGSYWSPDDERRVWDFVRKVMLSPIPKTFQNGLYDMTFLWKSYGIPTNMAEDDTMLLHHILQPESEKGLGFLGSVYTGEPAWKVMRPRGKTTVKREE